jgi:hypothetical protein
MVQAGLGALQNRPSSPLPGILGPLSFFAGVNLRDKQSRGEGLFVSQDYSIQWAPFPDGDLNFSLGYNRSIDTDDNESQILSPQIRWQISRSTLLTADFNIGTTESQSEKRDFKAFHVELQTYY